MTDDTALAARPPGRFPTTRWTLILSKRGTPESQRAALEELLAIYWKPLFLYARRKGLQPDAAEDAVQGFCLHLLERDFLDRLDRGRGSFRGYLRTSFDHYLINQFERARSKKRGGVMRLVPLDLSVAEQALAASTVDEPVDAFDREWALGIMERAMTMLRDEFESGKRRGEIEVILKFFRLGESEAPSYAQAAMESSMTEPQFKAALHRARERFRELVRREVADTVGSAEEVDAEVKELVRILGR